MKTMHLSPTVVIIGIEVNLVDGLDIDKIETIIDVIEKETMTIIPNSKKEYFL